MLEDRQVRNKLRNVILKARDNEIISKEEAGFIVTLVEKFRADIERKVRDMDIIRGELSQLKANEQIIMGVVENMIKAAERDRARQETTARLKEHREVERERDKEWEEKRKKLRETDSENQIKE